MRKHGGPPSRRDKHVTLAAISPPGVARGRFVGGQQSGLAGCKPPPLFTRGASSCSSQGRRQGEPWGASPRPSAPTYLLNCRAIQTSDLNKAETIITTECNLRLNGNPVPEHPCSPDWHMPDPKNKVPQKQYSPTTGHNQAPHTNLEHKSRVENKMRQKISTSQHKSTNPY